MIFEQWNLPEYSDKNARWNVDVDLSKKRYRLNVSWNSMLEGWILSIMDSQGKLILGGVRLSVGSYLLKKYKASCPDLPTGELWIQDLMDDITTAEVGRDDFSSRYKLCYGTWQDDNGDYLIGI
ncbi:MAG: hypothetical protein LBO67_04835 [Spirochaetaceae bacterium]|jgi:hypothetical protein|nr:hypothetical protein [Spirochaetaceae bacterium]